MIFVFGYLRPVSCVPNVVSIPGLSIIDCPFGLIYKYSHDSEKNTGKIRYVPHFILFDVSCFYVSLLSYSIC